MYEILKQHVKGSQAPARRSRLFRERHFMCLPANAADRGEDG